MPTEPRSPRRAPAGAAVLRQDVTDAIRAAVFEELAQVGYARMSIEAIARRAGVGKAAIYRRWRSKLRLVLEVVSAVAVQGMPTPDTGSLLGDVRALLEVTARVLRHPKVSQIVPDLLAEAARTPDIAEALQTALRDTQRQVATVVLRRGCSFGAVDFFGAVCLAAFFLSACVLALAWMACAVTSGAPVVSGAMGVSFAIRHARGACAGCGSWGRYDASSK